MSITIKTPAEIKSMQASGKILAEVLDECVKRAKPGVSTAELDKFAEKLIRQRGGTPGFKGYQGFPATLCTALNEIIVHGIPGPRQILKEGDLFTVDCGVLYEGMYTDAARSTGIGEISTDKQRLLKTAKKALSKAIDLAKPGVNINKISKIIQKTIENEGFHVIYDLTGHGIGRKLHEDPIVLNYSDGSTGAILKAGMCIAIEPIFSLSTSKMRTLDDNWTIVTSDGSPSVQEEHTVLITKKGAEILTK